MIVRPWPVDKISETKERKGRKTNGIDQPFSQLSEDPISLRLLATNEVRIRGEEMTVFSVQFLKMIRDRLSTQIELRSHFAEDRCGRYLYVGVSAERCEGGGDVHRLYLGFRDRS